MNVVFDPSNPFHPDCTLMSTARHNKKWEMREGLDCLKVDDQSTSSSCLVEFQKIPDSSWALPIYAVISL